MADVLYRVAWVAVQEDGSSITLHSPEYRSLDEATQDRDGARAIEYVTDAWIERAHWQRIDQPDGAAMRRANEIVDTGDDWTPEHVELAGRALSKGYADQWQAYRLGVYHGVLAEMERSGSSCICGPDSTGEAPDVRPDCVPCNEPGADIGEDPF